MLAVAAGDGLQPVLWLRFGLPAQATMPLGGSATTLCKAAHAARPNCVCQLHPKGQCHTLLHKAQFFTLHTHAPR